MNLSARALAKKAGVTHMYVLFLEKGQRLPTYSEGFLRIVEALELDLEEMILLAQKTKSSIELEKVKSRMKR